MNLSRLPWITLSCVIAALVAHVAPGLSEAWQYDRVAIGGGEWWRVLTGHLTHWNADHLRWDLIVFASLGAWAETTMPRGRYAVVLLGSMLAISAGEWWLQPEMATYRGLSGVDSALFGLLAARVLVDKWWAAEWPQAAGVALLLAGFAAKTVYESAFGATLFVDSAEAGFLPAPLAHLIGAGVGLLSVLVEKLSQGTSVTKLLPSIRRGTVGTAR